MSNRTDSQMHPVRQFFDWVSAGGRPTADDIDDVVSRCIGLDTELAEADLRRELSSARRRIAVLLDEGNAGAARQVGRETASMLVMALGELPARDRDAGRSVRDIVNDVPR